MGVRVENAGKDSLQEGQFPLAARDLGDEARLTVSVASKVPKIAPQFCSPCHEHQAPGDLAVNPVG